MYAGLNSMCTDGERVGKKMPERKRIQYVTFLRKIVYGILSLAYLTLADSKDTNIRIATEIEKIKPLP